MKREFYGRTDYYQECIKIDLNSSPIPSTDKLDFIFLVKPNFIFIYKCPLSELRWLVLYLNSIGFSHHENCPNFLWKTIVAARDEIRSMFPFRNIWKQKILFDRNAADS